MNKQIKADYFLKHRSGAFLWSIVILAAILRSYNLGSHNFWYDEFSSFLEMRKMNFGQFVLFGQNQLYFLFLQFWYLLFGKGEFALRFPSLIFGVLSIPLAYNIGKLLFNKQIGLASALLLAISPIHIWYSQEARAYTLATLLVMLMVYFLFLALSKHRLFLWACFILSSVTGMYTNYFCIYVLVTTGILFFFKSYRRFSWQLLLSIVVIIAAFHPISVSFIRLFRTIMNIYWIPKPHLNSIAITFDNFNAGYNATANTYFFTFIIFSLLFILGIYAWWSSKKDEIIILAFLLFIPIITTFFIARTIASVYLDRQLMLYSPFYYTIIAAGLVSIKRPIVKIASYCCIIVPIFFCLSNYYSLRMPVGLYHHAGVHLKKPVKPAADCIAEGWTRGDAIGYAGISGNSVFYYLWDKIINEKIRVFSFIIKSKLDSCLWGGQYICFAPNVITRHIVFLEDNDPFAKLEGYNFNRLWLVSSSYQKDGWLDRHSQGVRKWLRSHYSLLESKEFDGIFIDLYAKKTGPAGN